MQHGLKETRAVALMFSIVALYTLVVLASGKVVPGDFAELLGLYVGGSASILLVVALFSLMTLLVKNRPSQCPDPKEAPSPTRVIKTWVIGRWQRDHFLSLIWPPMLFAMLMTAFNAFKQKILNANAFTFDATFAEWDKAVFFGHDPWTITHAIFSQPWMTAAMDAAYHGWFIPMSIGVVACAFLPDSTWRLRTQYLLTYVLIWVVIGSFLSILTPSAGPAFYNDYVGPSQSFADLMWRLNDAASGYGAGEDGLGFLVSQDHLRGAYGSPELVTGGGISAMPSVHNALAVLFAITGFRIGKKTGWALTGYAVLTWIASVHLGWHYALDGVFAAIVTLGLWKVAGRVVSRLEAAPVRSPNPAIA